MRVLVLECLLAGGIRPEFGEGGAGVERLEEKGVGESGVIECFVEKVFVDGYWRLRIDGKISLAGNNFCGERFGSET
jgi:hypothetical protein